jgi:hypothetical protein
MAADARRPAPFDAALGVGYAAIESIHLPTENLNDEHP